jgi:hypothetical protein
VAQHERWPGMELAQYWKSHLQPTLVAAFHDKLGLGLVPNDLLERWRPAGGTGTIFGKAKTGVNI